MSGKQTTITGGATTITSSNLTASRALISNSSGKVAVSAVTSTELGYLDGVTSAIQTQLDSKAASSHGTHVSYGTSASALGTSSAGSASTVSRSDHVHALPALISCTGTLSVAKGGTGATTAANARTNLGLGSAATQSHTTGAPSSGSGALITSGAVYSALANKANSSHSHSYLPLSGGTLTGRITIPNGKYINSSSSSGANVDLIGINSSNNLHIGGNDDVEHGTYIHGSENYTQINYTGTTGANFSPNTSGSIMLGNASKLWSQIFSTNAVISTSDKNVKDNIKELTDIHMKLFMKLIPVSFTFKDGTSGRTHIGFISQDVEEVMTELEMTSLDFAGFCKDIKTVDVLDENGDIDHTEDVLDEDGNPVYIYSLRYEEFIGLITYVLQDTVHRMDKLEERLGKEGL